MKNSILGYKMLDCKKIKKSSVKRAVRKKLEMKDEVIIMKKSKMKKLAIIGAIAGTALISFTTVNAATDGAVMDKISDTFSNLHILINGKEVDKADVIKSEDGDTIVFEVEGGDNETITIEGVPDSEGSMTIVEYDGNGNINGNINVNDNSIVAEKFSSEEYDDNGNAAVNVDVEDIIYGIQEIQDQRFEYSE